MRARLQSEELVLALLLLVIRTALQQVQRPDLGQPQSPMGRLQAAAQQRAPLKGLAPAKKCLRRARAQESYPALPAAVLEMVWASGLLRVLMPLLKGLAPAVAHL